MIVEMNQRITKGTEMHLEDISRALQEMLQHLRNGELSKYYIVVRRLFVRISRRRFNNRIPAQAMVLKEL